MAGLYILCISLAPPFIYLDDTTMSKVFKIGDKVRVTSYGATLSYYVEGDILTITDIDESDGMWEIAPCNGVQEVQWFHDPSEFTDPDFISIEAIT